MNSVEEYARRWTKSVGEELDTLSEWIKSIRKLLKSRIDHLAGEMRTIYPSVFKKPEVVNEFIDYKKTLYWFQLIKQVTTLSLFVKVTIILVF